MLQIQTAKAKIQNNFCGVNDWGAAMVSSMRPIGRAAVTFGPLTRTVEKKVLFNLLTGVPKPHPIFSRANHQQNTDESNEKVQ